MHRGLMGRGKSATHKEHVKGAETKQQCFILRRRGYSYQEIADELGIAAPTAYEHVRSTLATMRETTGEIAEEVREMEIKRLDTMTRALAARVERGDDKAIETTLKLLARKAAYLGLDAATKQELAVTTSLYDLVKKADEKIESVVEETKETE